LLVLDNFEQLADQATAVERWAKAAPGARFLLTSRLSLAVTGEVLELEPLPLQAATELFEARARATCGDKPLDPAQVREIVHQLEGLPLTLELAAARAEQLPFVAANLDRRLDVLVRAAPGAVSPHSTLRGALDWSWDLLGSAEREALVALTLFEGVAPRPLLPEPDLVARLCALSLVREVNDGLELSETVRDYGRERLAMSGRQEPVARGHAERVVAAANEVRKGLGKGRRHNAALWLLRLLCKDLRTVVARGPEELRADAAVRVFNVQKLDGPTIGGVELLAPAAAHTPRIHSWLAEALLDEGRFEEGLQFAMSGRAAAVTPLERIYAERSIASALRRLGRLSEALERLEPLCSDPDVLTRPEQWLRCQNNLASLLIDLERLEEARRVAEAAMQRAREINDSELLLHLLQKKANAHYKLGAWADAVAAYDEAHDLARQLDSAQLTAMLSGTSIQSLLRVGDLERAEQRMAEWIRAAQQVGGDYAWKIEAVQAEIAAARRASAAS
jgi:tetratricopeptide (TPR) repeat protein